MAMAEMMLLLMLVAMPMAPEPYRTMSTAWMRSAVPLGATMYLGYSVEAPGSTMSSPPPVSAVPPRTKRPTP